MATTKNAGKTGGNPHSHSARNLVRSCPAAVADLPKPPATCHGLPHGNHSVLRRLEREGVLIKEERCDGEHPACSHRGKSQCKVWVWKVSVAGWEMIQEELELRTLLPCGHPPFRNPRDIEGLTCTNDDCDARYSRSKVREVMG